jgi:membrane fusion protein
MSQLFRSKAIAGRQRQLLGDVVLVQPLSHWVLTFFLACVVVAAGALLSAGSYARRETVSGFLVPDHGVVRVHAPRAGVVGQLHVAEGATVRQGDALLTLLGDRTTGAGIAVDERMLLALDVQLLEIENRRQLEQQRRAAEVKRLDTELAGLAAEQQAIDSQIRIQRNLLRNVEENLARIRQLVAKGYVSDDEYLARQQSLLANRQTLASLEQKRVLNTNHARQGALQLERTPIDSNKFLSELNSLQADLQLKRTELEAQRSITITAPLAGTVAVLRAISGTSVDTRLPLLALLPQGALLEAQLFVPSRAIGFIETGQEVRLLYDAFDYRRFGAHVGTVSEVSTAVFSPAESPAGMQISEPSYRVTVRLREQSVGAYGEQFLLQAGMVLRADILLEQRTLIDWLLDPLRSLKGRT